MRAARTLPFQRRDSVLKYQLGAVPGLTPARLALLFAVYARVWSAANTSNYGFHPPANPRAHKSLCDDARVIPLQEAQRLFVAGVRKSMVSTYRQGSLPKYVWSVDDRGEAYESKLGNDGYHGYRLDEESEKTMRALVLKEWGAR